MAVPGEDPTAAVMEVQQLLGCDVSIVADVGAQQHCGRLAAGLQAGRVFWDAADTRLGGFAAVLALLVAVFIGYISWTWP